MIREPRLRFFITGPTGEERELDASYVREDASWSEQEFWWTEGNGGCDCNRALFFDRMAGDEKDFGEYCCNVGPSEYRLRVTEDGVVVYDETSAVKA